MTSCDTRVCCVALSGYPLCASVSLRSLPSPMASDPVNVSSKAIFYTTSETKAGGRLKTSKQNPKTKKFTWDFSSISEDSDDSEKTGYLGFLQELLETHDQRFLVTRKARFGFKYKYKGQKCAFLAIFSSKQSLIDIYVMQSISRRREEGGIQSVCGGDGGGTY